MSMEAADDIDDDIDDELVDDDAPEGDDDAGGDDDDDGPSEIEALALKAGWKPKADWKGEGWVPADQFLVSGANRAKSAKREARELAERMDTLESTHRVSLDRQAENLKAQASAMKKAAIAKGGDKAVEEVEAIEKVLDEELAKLKGAAEPAPMKLTALDKAYFSNHSWMFDDDTFEGEGQEEADEAMELYQATVASVMKATGDANEAHDRAGKAVRKAFAHRYEDDEDGGAAKGGKGQNRPGRRTPDLARGYQSGAGRGAASKLPPEALKAAEDCVKRGIYANKDEFAEVYFAEQKKGRRA